MQLLLPPRPEIPHHLRRPQRSHLLSHRSRHLLSSLRQRFATPESHQRRSPFLPFWSPRMHSVPIDLRNTRPRPPITAHGRLPGYPRMDIDFHGQTYSRISLRLGARSALLLPLRRNDNPAGRYSVHHLRRRKHRRQLGSLPGRIHPIPRRASRPPCLLLLPRQDCLESLYRQLGMNPG